MVIYPVDSATVISCRAYILLHSKPLLSNMYLYFRMSQYIFFSRKPYYVHKQPLPGKRISSVSSRVFFLFSCLVLFFVCLFVFIFMFALSQFSGPDYLAAWNRLVRKMFVAIGITLCFISGKKCIYYGDISFCMRGSSCY